MLEQALAALPHAASIVLSDYAKGLLTPRVIRTLIDAARKLGKPVIVDPKGKDFSLIPRGDADHPEPARSSPKCHARTLAGEADIACGRWRAQQVDRQRSRAGDAQ